MSWITFLACCNNDGSEKCRWWSLETRRNCERSKQKTREKLGIAYYDNKKAWIKQELFFAWRHRLDPYISTTPERKIQLLIENCLEHGNWDTLPKLNIVCIEFILPNTTSKVHALDAGIIAWVNRNYRSMLLFHVLENIEAEKNSIYNFHVFTVIQWTFEERSVCPAKVIRICFDRSFKWSAEFFEIHSSSILHSLVDNTVRDAEKLGVDYTRAGLNSFLKSLEEDNVTGVITIEALGREIVPNKMYQKYEDEAMRRMGTRREKRITFPKSSS